MYASTAPVAEPRRSGGTLAIATSISDGYSTA
jgi:hypothetical protein